jgi:predicted RNA-binding Zn ribbon-like protein
MNSHAGGLRLIGGRLCLDFVNTVDSHQKPQPKEYLVDYAAFVTWGRHVGMFDHAAMAELLRAAALRPVAAADVLQHTKALRRALYQICSAIAGGHVPSLAGISADALGATQADVALTLATLNDALAAAPRRSRIVYTSPGFGWECDGDADPLEQPLRQVLWSAADLLTTAELALVRECAGEGCSWLFLDTSRNRSRLWCSMEDCGNRAKARRHYARKQKENRD